MKFDRIICGDCIKWLSKRREPFADLVFADPPFNIGYKYDSYRDKKGYDEYLAWTDQWMKACCRVLKPTGSFWVAIGDDYAAEVRLIGRELGLYLRNWVIWHYTFGQNTKKKFARSHTHLFYWTKSPTEYVFRDMATRVPSDRQAEYNDRRASGTGKVPDDVWAEFPRVCGTFRQREGWHPCQMPESILARIIRVCTHPGNVVLDPFAGSGTTLVVAKKTGRHYLGIELSEGYTGNIRQRLRRTRHFDDIEGEGNGQWPKEHLEELCALYAEARIPTDKLYKNRSLVQSFAQQFNWRIECSGAVDSYTVENIWAQLERLRKSGKLPRVRTHVREVAKDDIRPFQDELF